MSSYSVSEDWDLDLVCRLFTAIRGVPVAGDRFSWQYLHNPSGQARVWILFAPSGEPVGFTAAYPREIWVDGTPCRALNCGDFSVDVGHRTLGPAVVLRRPAKALVDAGEFDLLYAHPLPAMLKVHSRVGHAQLGEMRRWVYVLRSRGALSRRLGPRVSSLLAPVADAGLRLRRALNFLRRANVVIQQSEAFGPEYDALDEQLGQHYPVIGRRTQAYLNWRFLQRPGLDPSILEARDSEGRLVGYLIWEAHQRNAKVLDLAFLPGSGAGRALVMHALAGAASTNAEGLSLVLQRACPGLPEIRQLGFWERVEQHPIVCYGGAGFWGKARVENESNWFMTVGDRDL